MKGSSWVEPDLVCSEENVDRLTIRERSEISEGYGASAAGIGYREFDGEIAAGAYGRNKRQNEAAKKRDRDKE